MPTPVERKRCTCGRDEARPGQRDCRQCHNEDMRARRRMAKARGTYSVAGVHLVRKPGAPGELCYVEHRPVPSGTQYAGFSPEQRRHVNCRSHTKTLVARGTLVRQPCEHCGRTDGVEAHHEDYSKPRKVRWLCFEHHRALHRGELELTEVAS